MFSHLVICIHVWYPPLYSTDSEYRATELHVTY